MSSRIIASIIDHSHFFQILIKAERKHFLEKRRARLTNKNPSIISSNCNGGVIAHDLGLKFLSPTVNLWFTASDFLKIMGSPKRYLSAIPVEVDSEYPYPVGKLLDIYVYFQHYESFEIAKTKWIERSARIDYNNLFFMMTDREGCTVEQIKEFDKYPYINKVLFTHIPYSNYQSTFYIKGFEQYKECGILTDYKPGFLRRRYIDDFDSVSFLNCK